MKRSRILAVALCLSALGSFAIAAPASAAPRHHHHKHHKHHHPHHDIVRR